MSTMPEQRPEIPASRLARVQGGALSGGWASLPALCAGCSPHPRTRRLASLRPQPSSHATQPGAPSLPCSLKRHPPPSIGTSFFPSCASGQGCQGCGPVLCAQARPIPDRTHVFLSLLPPPAIHPAVNKHSCDTFARHSAEPGGREMMAVGHMQLEACSRKRGLTGWHARVPACLRVGRGRVQDTMAELVVATELIIRRIKSQIRP